MESKSVAEPSNGNGSSFLFKFGAQYNLTLVNVLLVRNVFNFVGFYLSIYYIDVLDMTDIEAGLAASLNSSQLIFLFLIGGLGDYFGARDSLILASSIAIIDLFFLILIKNVYVQVILIGIGLSIVAVILFISLKLSVIATTNENNHSQGFSLYTAVGNISIVIFGPLLELIISLQGTTFKAFHTFFIVSIFLYFLAILLNLCYSDITKAWRTDPTIPSPIQILRKSIVEKRLWKLIAVNTIGSIPMACLYQFGFVLPIYMKRELSESSNYGILIAVFSLIMAVFCPLLTPMVKYFSIYNCMIIGGVIIGLAQLVFAIGNNLYIIAVYMIINAIGGAIFEARVIDYNAKVAKTSSQGFYLSVVGVLYSLLPIPNGLYGGLMLSYYCPEDGERNCWIMWYFIGALSFFGTFLLFIFKKFIEDKDEYSELNHNE